MYFNVRILILHSLNKIQRHFVIEDGQLKLRNRLEDMELHQMQLSLLTIGKSEFRSPIDCGLAKNY